MAKTASSLIAEAQRLIEQAKHIEQLNALKIGKYVMSNIGKLTLDDLKKIVTETTGEALEETTEKPAKSKKTQEVRPEGSV